MDPSYPNSYPFHCPYPHPGAAPPPLDPNQQRPPYLQSANSFPFQPQPDPQFNQYPPPSSYVNAHSHAPHYYNPYPNPYPYPDPYNPNPPPPSYNPNPPPLNYNPADHLSNIQITELPDSTNPPSNNPSASHLYLTPTHSLSSHHGASPSPGGSGPAHNLQMVSYNGGPPLQNSNTQVLPYSRGSLQHYGGSAQMVPYGGEGSQHGSMHGGSQHGNGQTPLKVLLLHGSLDIWVCEARNLPNLDMLSKRVGDMLGTRLSSMGKLDHMSSMTSDPYVSIVVGGAVVGRTYTTRKNDFADKF